MEEGRHGAIGPAAQEGHPGRVGEAVAHDEIGLVAHPPEAFEVGGMMLAVAVEKKEPVRGAGQPGQGVMEGGGLAVVRSRKDMDVRAGFRGEEGGGVVAGVVDDRDGKSGREASAHDARDGGGFVARGDENPGGRFVLRTAGAAHGGIFRRSFTALRRSAMSSRRPRAYRLG